MNVRFVKPWGIYSPGRVVEGFPGGVGAELARRGIVAAAELVAPKRDDETKHEKPKGQRKRD